MSPSQTNALNLFLFLSVPSHQYYPPNLPRVSHQALQSWHGTSPNPTLLNPSRFISPELSWGSAQLHSSVPSLGTCGHLSQDSLGKLVSPRESLTLHTQSQHHPWESLPGNPLHLYSSLKECHVIVKLFLYMNGAFPSLHWCLWRKRLWLTYFLILSFYQAGWY